MTDRTVGDRYTSDSYRRAIWYGCEKAFPLPDALKRQRIGKRWETSKEWRDRLGKKWAEANAWRQQHRWHPHQLRHSMATQVRREFGLEAAQVFIGHASADVTQIYAERDRDRAVDVALKIG